MMKRSFYKLILYTGASLLLCSAPAIGQPSPHFATTHSALLDSNPYLSKKAKKRIAPHLIPDSHPIKEALDAIFTSSRATQNETTLRDAGFEILYSQPTSLVRVVRHPALAGYLLKLYPDSELRNPKNDIPCWIALTKRCEAARNIRKLIKKKKLQFFTVPDKWIYPLPLEPSPPDTPEYRRQPIVLVVQDMNLPSRQEIARAWKEKPTRQHLEELYCILSHGYSSSHLVENIPYTNSGLFACVDTEHPKRKPNLEPVVNYVSKEMSIYWVQLVGINSREN
jgi:hypothetical protein